MSISKRHTTKWDIFSTSYSTGTSRWYSATERIQVIYDSLCNAGSKCARWWIKSTWGWYTTRWATYSIICSIDISRKYSALERIQVNCESIMRFKCQASMTSSQQLWQLPIQACCLVRSHHLSHLYRQMRFVFWINSFITSHLCTSIRNVC